LEELGVSKLEGGWLAPDEEWPRHTHAEWRITLDVARQHGWFLKPAGHRFGILVCLLTDGDRAHHKFPIDRTASGTEDFAKDVRQKIKSCTHRATGLHESPVDQANILLDAAARLLNAVEECLSGMETRSHAEDLLNEACVRIEEIEVLEARFEEIAVRSAEGQGRVDAGVVSARAEGLDLGDPPRPELALEIVEERAGQAHGLVRGASGAGAMAVRARIRDLRARAAALGIQVEAARER
jgi:hypothetical protein